MHTTDTARPPVIFRRREMSIGVAPELIGVELRATLETIGHRWRETEDWTPRQLGIAVHAEIVRIHPFTDGNGRTTRLLADLVFAAAQDAATPDLYDWDIDKRGYIDLLREYDEHRDPRALARFVPVKAFGK
jgi:fido (protein-threonine AMPylation protein)